MHIQRGFKYQLKIEDALEHLFWQQAGACRFIWNLMLKRQQYRLSRAHRVESFATMCLHLTQIKKHHIFLKDVDSTALQQKLRDLVRAYDDGFDKTQPHKAMPVPKKKFQCTNSFRYTQRVKVEGNRVYLPKLGWFRFHKSRDIIGNIKNATVSYEDGRWYVSFQTEYARTERPHRSSSLVGVDLGVKRLATLSSGQYVEGINQLRKHESRLAFWQRKLAKKVKFSANWKKIKEKITRLHRKIARCRKDFLHKFSSYLSKNHAMIVFENLKVKNLSASAKGSIEAPGSQVKQKAGLNKAILDQGWGMLMDFCAYKQRWKNGDTLTVNPSGTSQTCSQCGHRQVENRQSQAVFKCLSCHHKQNADDNASLNIAAAGHAVLACREKGLPFLLKQEPVEWATAQSLVFN